MDKRIAVLFGAAAALTTVGRAQAAIPERLAQTTPPASYAELLIPVSNATAALKDDDTRLAQKSAAEVRLAQYHHHHHHNYRYHHHHHHYLPPVVRHFIHRPHHHHHHHYR